MNIGSHAKFKISHGYLYYNKEKAINRNEANSNEELASFRVGYTIELSNKFIDDFEKIIQFLSGYGNIQTKIN